MEILLETSAWKTGSVVVGLLNRALRIERERFSGADRY